MPANPAIQKTRLSCGIDLAFRTGGDSNRSALVLLHGFPSSSRSFRDVIEPLIRKFLEDAANLRPSPAVAR
jgi:pimeloyl-ACP methyl ester carboxylesterase